MIWEPGATRPLSEEDLKAWEGRLERGRRRRKNNEPRWEAALERYRRSKAANYDVNALLDFRHTHTKASQLFYQTPEVQLHPIDPVNPEIPESAIMPQRQKVLNQLLGPDGADAKGAIHETLFDCLAVSGWLIVEIGFDARTATDPLTGTTVAIWGKPFFSRVSPKKLIVPDDFRSTKFDRAPWLAVDGTMPLTKAKRVFSLPPEFDTTSSRDEHVFRAEGESPEDGERMVEYTTIWYRAEDFDETIINPELYRLLVLVKGHDIPAKHVDSPFQAIDPNTGRLLPMSMQGNPIHVGTLRDMSDSAYIDSDLVVGEQLVNEVNKFRTSQMRNRIGRQTFNLIDPDGFPDSELEKLKAGEKTIFVKPGQLTSGQPPPIVSVTPGQEPRDNYTAQDYAERDWQGALGTADNQSGQLSKNKRTTATEARITQGNSNSRADTEKDRLREYYIKAAQKFDCVVGWTITPEDLVQILGQQGAAIYEAFRAIGGRYIYKMLPDSGVHVDAAQFRAQKLDEYNLLRKDPQVNASELLAGLARALGHDPAKLVLPQAPEAGPDPMKFSMAIKGDDLALPQSQACVEILAQNGITISEGAIQSLIAGQAQAAALAQAEAEAQIIGSGKQGHGGSANVTEKINQHSSEKTGGVQGVGIQ